MSNDVIQNFARSLFFVLGNYLCGSHVDLVYILYTV